MVNSTAVQFWLDDYSVCGVVLLTSIAWQKETLKLSLMTISCNRIINVYFVFVVHKHDKDLLVCLFYFFFKLCFGGVQEEH